MKRHTQLYLTALIAIGIGAFALVNAQMPARLTADDYTEIQQLYARYNISLDSGDAEAYAGTFVSDGTFNNFKGHDALVGFANNWHNKMKGANMRHWNTNLAITAAPGGAKGFVYLMLMDLSSKPPVISTMATYDDQLVKTPQGWRFAKRVTKADTAVPPPAESK